MSLIDPPDLPGWPLDLAANRYAAEHHGDYPRWAEALASLPGINDARSAYGDTVTVDGDVDTTRLGECLMALHPWRKGPFQIGGVRIDTEWRSDWKWRRVAPAVGNLAGGRVLDIGCGNGYFGWRMLEAGASEVIGIDPTLLFCMQHLAIRHYTRDFRNWVLPLGIDDVPLDVTFDLVLSMGVVYHRRDAQAHVDKLAALTRPGGRVVLESLIVEADESLVPEGRYARMRNVWCVPTIATMHGWLQNAGLRDIEVVSVDVTTTEEQRSTSWMHFESLSESLDPNDPTLTIEGHPAPCRAVLIARR